MVAGGWSGSAPRDTTEVYRDNEWRTVSGKLPHAMTQVRVTTLNDKILLFGKIILSDDCSLFLKL